MAVKKISYTTEQADSRLGQAHIHENLEALDKITESDLEKIDGALQADMSNVNPDEFAKAVKETNLTFEDVPDSDNLTYVRINGKWKKLIDAETIVQVGSDTLLVKENDTIKDPVTDQYIRKYGIDLKEEDRNTLAAVNDKLDKLPQSSVPDALVTADADGYLGRSDLKASMIVTSDKLSTNPSKSSKTVAASEYAVNIVNTKLEQLQAGISSCKGCVVNAFTTYSDEEYIGIHKVSVVSDCRGSGYTIGDIVNATIPGEIIPCRIKVADVDSVGAIQAVEVMSSDTGYYNSTALSEVIANKASVAVHGSPTGTGARIIIEESTSGKAANTLSSIVSPEIGDFAFVAMDETHGNKGSIYTYVRVTFSEQDSKEMWLFTYTYTGHIEITRYV